MLTALPAASLADDELLEAMSRLVRHGLVSEPPGELADGNFMEFYSSQSGAEAHVMSPAGDPCVLLHLWVMDRTGEHAQVVTKTYDFRKLTGARFLADGDDWENAPSREPDDPEVTELLLNGPGWSVARFLNVDPAQSSFHQEIENNWSIVLLGAEDREAATRALETVNTHCAP